MCPRSDSRAASAIFRAFGGAGKPCHAGACHHAAGCDMHVVEQRFLALWIPLTVWVATGAVLGRWLEMPIALWVAIPAGFIVLNILPLALGGRSPLVQWRIWLLAGTLWAVFHRDAVEKDAAKALKRILTKITPREIVLVHEATPNAAQVMEGLLVGSRHLRK